MEIADLVALEGEFDREIWRSFGSETALDRILRVRYRAKGEVFEVLIRETARNTMRVARRK